MAFEEIKAGLEKYPNRKYYGNPVYHNLRYRFQYRNQLYMGLTAEKDAGEPFLYDILLQ